MDRNQLILSGCRKSDLIVEIGPSHAPIAAKREGWSTIVVDHASQEVLRAKYAQFPGVDIDRIEAVDRIWQGGPLDALFDASQFGRIQRIISSHSIEHLPDPVGFLVAAGRLTHPQTGTVCLAVPDKRQCFDVFRPLTSTGDWLDAWRDKRQRHGGASVFDHLAYLAQVDDGPCWPEPTVDRPRLLHTLEQAFELYTAYEDGGRRDYVDVHGWVFTPASFELLILELWLLGLIDWEVESCQTTMPHEFVVLLRRATRARPDAVEQNLRRHRLLRRVAEEVASTVGAGPAGALAAAPLPDGKASREEALLQHVQQLGHELTALRQELAEMRGTQRELQRLLDLLRRLRARCPRWLGGTRPPRSASANGR